MNRTRAAAIIALACISGLTAGCAGPGGNITARYQFDVTFQSSGTGVPIPLTVAAPPGLAAGEQAWEVVSASGETVPAQFTGDGKLIFLWSHSGMAGKEQFKLQPCETATRVFAIDENLPEQLLISENGRPVIGYVFGMHLAGGVPEDRRRASYFHPVWGVNGRVLSDDFPADHYHHRGIFWTWPQVFYGSDTLSLWDIRGIYQKFESWTERESGPVFARLGVQNGWYLEDGRRIVDERVTATIYRGTDQGRIIDFDLRWVATGERVGIQGSADIKGYGGFSLRFAPFEQPVITTRDSVLTGDSNRVPTPWAALSARFSGESGYEGVAIFDHSENLDFPNGWCLRHYGFEGIAWPGIEPYWLEPGRPLTQRYRVWIHDGDAVAGKVAEAYNSWAKPPSADAAQ